MGLINRNIAILKLLEARLAKTYFPLFVMYNITNRCNLKCSYCFSKFYERKEEELTTNQIFVLVEELAALGTKRIAISGGEPLLRADLPQVIKFIKGKGIECGINSNGVLIPQRIEEIKSVNSICISLDGPEEIHDRYRGEGSFKKVMTAIEVIKKYKIPLHLSMVLTKNNYNYIGFILDFAKQRKILVQISPLYNQIYGEKNKDFPEVLSDGEYHQVVNEILKYKAKGYPVFYSRRNYLNILKWPDYAKSRIIGEAPHFKSIKCWAGKYMCSIEANGEVYPCGYFAGHKALNCRDDGFKKAFADINNHNCQACLWACYSELNLMLGLNFSVLLNQFINSLFENGSNS